MDIEAELRRGVALHRQGQVLEAERCFAGVLERKPASFDALHLLGMIALQTGRSSRAVELIARALAIDARVAAAHHHLGLALRNLGRREESLASLRRAVALRPEVAAMQANLSAMLLELGHFDEALECAERALALSAESLPGHLNRAAALGGLGRHREALAACDRVVALEPGNVEAWLMRGALLLELDAAQPALESFRRAAELHPDSARADAGCGAALLSLNRPREALECSERALQRQPQLLAAQCNRAGALLALERAEEARAAYEQALRLPGDPLAALCGRGQACQETGDREAARESYRRALEIAPDHAPAHVGLLTSAIPVIAASDADVERSRAELAEELTRFESWQSARTVDEPALVRRAQPFYLAYQERPNKELLARWGSLCAELMARWAGRERLPPAPARARRSGVVRVGIVTAHASEHSVYRALMKGWLERLDRRRVEITLFHLGAARDSATTAAGAHAELLDCAGYSFGECVRAIHAAGLDALIYPEVGMHGTTLALASLRLAPHQLATWGHPETTGLPTIDYFLSAEAFEPPQADAHYREKLIRLPGIGCYYEPYGLVTEPAPARGSTLLPDLGEGPVLVCAATPYKYAPEYDSVLVEIARELPRCQLLFFEAARQGLSARLLARMQAAFRSAGLDPQQYLRLVPWMSLDQLFELFQGSDVYLDTLGFSGFNTAMHAVECALPMVAYEGRFLRGRFASGILRSLGMGELVARSPAEYVQQVVALARDPSMRAKARERLQRQRPLLYGDRAALDALTEFLAALAR